MVSLDWLEPDWGHGTITTVVCIDQQLGSSTWLCHAVLGDQVCILHAFPAELDAGTMVTVVGFESRATEDLFVLSTTDGSDWFLHPTPSGKLVTDFRKLCAGMAALGTGAIHAGFRVVGVNELQERTAAVASHVTGVSVAIGDVASDACLVHMWKAFPRETGVAAGFSCQPFSALGDQRGRHDARSRSLVGVLRAAFLFQAPWVVLECVAPAGCNKFVLSCLNEFCQALNYQMASIELELAHVWCAHRKNWWCVISKVGLPAVVLRNWRPSASCRAVGDVLQCPEQGGKAVEQMLLSQYEASEFSQRRPLDMFVLRSKAAMPTALHAWGAQVLPCP